VAELLKVVLVLLAIAMVGGICGGVGYGYVFGRYIDKRLKEWEDKYNA